MLTQRSVPVFPRRYDVVCMCQSYTQVVLMLHADEVPTWEAGVGGRGGGGREGEGLLAVW